MYDRLWPLFHKDPLVELPVETMSQVFSYLEPAMLLEASRVCRAWRTRICDPGLWKQKFQTEGWALDTDQLAHYEKTFNLDLTRKEMLRAHHPLRTSAESRLDIARSMQPSSVHHADLEESNIGPAFSTSSKVEAQNATNEDQEMMDAEEVSRTERRRSERDVELYTQPCFAEAIEGRSDQTDILGGAGMSETDPIPKLEQQPLMIYSSPMHSRLNYQYIFKQKMKLEENWNSGNFKSFQLPHRDHPEDAHTECVYTIQYRGNYLVSGSRDRTLRIWDLETGRLARKPLKGHSGSVLCLQFDDRQEEDIIISGSSDTHVILWRFSTGELIKTLSNAHRESVLNLKFDHRFLVTCSKDKTIKLWNRHELRPGDEDYPVKGVKTGGSCPAYILDMPTLENPQYTPTSPEHRMLLEQYTHLMTLELHGAAVNAIQIYKNQLVSASGDRNLRVWNIHTGECPTKIEAHAKGIACVQYDGKRIVSGSSDNSIRIWDPVSQVEVARLEGHGRLVRTIQAAFADFPGGKDRLEAEAAEVDKAWQIAKEQGQVLRPQRNSRPARPGSRKPNDLRALGAKIPPSGGGSKWGRIVSGSYDETVIIWKKTEDDEWIIGHRLRQEEALTAAGPPLSSNTQASQPANTANPNQPTNGQPPPQAPATAPSLPLMSTGQIPHPNIAQSSRHHNPSIGRAYRQLMLQQPGFPNSNLQTTSAANMPPLPAMIQTQSTQTPTNQTPSAPLPALQPVQPIYQPHAAPVQPPHPVAPVHPMHQAARLHNQGNGNGTNGQPNARVFKLQFDARRIICCSQDNKIVGWDFANGDSGIGMCSKFFSAPQ